MINVIGKNGEKLRHGILEMSGKKKLVNFKGFYYGNFFMVQSIVEKGENTYEVLEYEEVNSVPMDEKYTELISFVRKKEGYEVNNEEILNIKICDRLVMS